MIIKWFKKHKITLNNTKNGNNMKNDDKIIKKSWNNVKKYQKKWLNSFKIQKKLIMMREND